MKDLNNLERKLSRNYPVDNQLWKTIQNDLPKSSNSFTSILLSSILCLFLICVPFMLIEEIHSDTEQSKLQINPNVDSTTISLISARELKADLRNKKISANEFKDEKQNEDISLPIQIKIPVPQLNNTSHKHSQKENFNNEKLIVECIPIDLDNLSNDQSNNLVLVKPAPYSNPNNSKRNWKWILSSAYGFGKNSNTIFYSNLKGNPISKNDRKLQQFLLFAGAQKGLWAIESGIGFSKIQQQSSISLNHSIETPLFEVINPNYKTSSGRNVLLIRMNENPKQLKDTTMERILVQSVNVISIPIRLSMKIPINNRLSLDFGTGIQTYLGSKNHKMHYSDIDQSLLEQLSIAKNSIEVKPLSQFGINYKLNSNFGFSYKLQTTWPGNDNLSAKSTNLYFIKSQFFELNYSF